MATSKLDREEFNNMLRLVQAGDEPVVWHIDQEILSDVAKVFDFPPNIGFPNKLLGISVEIPAGDHYFQQTYLEGHWPIELITRQDCIIGYRRQREGNPQHFRCAVVISNGSRDSV